MERGLELGAEPAVGQEGFWSSLGSRRAKRSARRPGEGLPK